MTKLQKYVSKETHLSTLAKLLLPGKTFELTPESRRTLFVAGTAVCLIALPFLPLLAALNFLLLLLYVLLMPNDKKLKEFEEGRHEDTP